MDKFQINITGTINEDKLQTGLFIFMFRATRIPPHLGIIANGKLYDISLQGPNTDIPVDEFYKTVKKRKSEVVFIELNKPQFSSFLDDEIKYLVNKYWKVTPAVSCLAPVKDFLNEVYSVESVQTADFIFELLPILEQNNLIKEISEIGLFNKLKNNSLNIIKYTKKDIENCIEALNRKQQQIC